MINGNKKMKEHISVKEILDYCNSSADVCKKLHEDALKRYGKTGGAYDISAMAHFMREEKMFRYEIPNIIMQLAEEHEEKTFGEKVTRLLKESGITQRRLAENVGVTEAAMSRYISGERVAKGPIFAKIAKELGTTVEYLIGE